MLVFLVDMFPQASTYVYTNKSYKSIYECQFVAGVCKIEHEEVERT